MKLNKLSAGILLAGLMIGSVSAMEMGATTSMMKKNDAPKCIDAKKATRAEVRKFQRENGITSTGHVGKITKAKLVSLGCNKEVKKDEVVMKKDIIDTAVSVESLSTLVAAVKAADLVTTLKGNGPFTVFAPNNAAFAKLATGTVETLLKAEKKADLTGILTYHVVAGKYTADKITDGLKLKTVSGKDLTFSVRDGKVMINGNSTVISANVETSNGVVHVIDTVLLP